MSEKLFSFEPVKELPSLKRSRTGLYQDIIRQFEQSGQSAVKLNWKGKASLLTVAVSLRKVAKGSSVAVSSRSRMENGKRIVYEIYLSKTEQKKKGR